ncbi:MAG: hypothetical protein CMB80_01905 [Flammeovirgaceae bacterium]|nr:hypothetical protein [Flammeovirgaceae bacterium]|tara:strand:- start:511 stop:690 length:180 start_codon:yes stop_codon:yes gene_type:complete
MSDIKLTWWDHIVVTITVFLWICRYGLDGANEQAEKEIKRLKKEINKKKNYQSIIDNWK